MSDFYNTSRIFKHIHVEMTNKCNLACPMCPRIELLEKKMINNKEDLSLKDFKKIFDPIKDNIEKFYLSGNYSDPLMNSEIEDIIDYILEETSARIQIGTNGSLRNPQFFESLGHKFFEDWLKNKRANCILFAIDGLEDTNHIYRVNSNWNKIIDNTSAFINAGGFAEWKYVVFGHNEHQVDEAEALSRKMGFARFVKVISTRFINTDGEVYVDELDNKAKKESKNAKVTRSTGDYDVNKFINQDRREIKCDAIHEKNGIFVTDKGLVMPCCWLGNDFGYNIDIHGPADSGIKYVTEKYPNWKNELNAIENNIIDIFNHPFWDTVESLWHMDEPSTCMRQCGKKLDDIKIESNFTSILPSIGVYRHFYK